MELLYHHYYNQSVNHAHTHTHTLTADAQSSTRQNIAYINKSTFLFQHVTYVNCITCERLV